MNILHAKKVWDGDGLGQRPWAIEFIVQGVDKKSEKT